MKLDIYHKVSNLTLKWCKMSFYFIHFQCEILNMTSLDVKFFVRQKVKFNAVFIEYHGDLGVNYKFPVQ